MINISKKSNCCGCGSCQQVCPKQCISMECDEEGFWYPEVDADKCVDCGLCERSCPIILKPNKNDKQIKECFVSYATDEQLRLKSSSGGLFTLFAEKVLNESGVVFGAAFDNEQMVHHIKISSLEGLELLRGSKYLQSRIENTYAEAKNELENGTTVLFSGTQCQISGLKRYLKNDYNNLYTVDVLCHGVPSPKVWKWYLKKQEKLYGSTVQQTLFRQKDFGWKMFAVELTFCNSTAYRNKFIKDIFMNLFLANICLRPSCHDCKFKMIDRESDVTIGDCWGINKHMPEMDDDKGTSVVIIHSDKGKCLFDTTKEKMKYKSVELDVALPLTADSRKSVMAHKNRSKFFKLLNNNASTKQLMVLVKPPLWLKIYRKCKRLVKKLVM